MKLYNIFACETGALDEGQDKGLVQKFPVPRQAPQA